MKRIKKTLVLMAAGFGSRFGGGVRQLESVGPHGEVLMDYAIYDALREGFDRVAFIIRRKLEDMLRQSVGKRTEAKCDVEYVHQELTDLPTGFVIPQGRMKPWGTGHAVLACRNVIDDPFCVINADDYYGSEAFQRIHDELYVAPKYDDGVPVLCMVGYFLGNTLSESGGVTRGLCHVDADGFLKSIQETHGIEMRNGEPCVEKDGVLHHLDRSTVVSMNIWGMPASFIDDLSEDFERFLNKLPAGDVNSEYLIPTVVGDMVHANRIKAYVLPTTGHWFGMTYAQDKLFARQRIRELIEQGGYPERL